MVKVSVIFTSYNHGKFLRESLQSVLSQTYKDFEVVVVDDYSTDDSRDIIRSFQEKDERIVTYFHEKNYGYCLSKELIEFCRGEYIAMMHSDDVWETGKLEKQVPVLDENPEVGACFTWVQLIDEIGAPINDKGRYTDFNVHNRTRYEWLHHFFMNGNCLCHPSVLLRKEIQLSENLFTKGIGALPDFYRWIKLCTNHDIYIIEEKLTKFRIRANGANTSGQNAGNLLKVKFDLLQVMELYAAMPAETLKKTFPELAKYVDPADFVKDYALAMLCLHESEQPPVHLFGLKLLYNYIQDDDHLKQLEQKYQFNRKSFSALYSSYDVFNTLLSIDSFYATLYFDEGNGYSEDNKVNQRVIPTGSHHFQISHDNVGKKVRSIRFDPDEGKYICLRNLQVIINDLVVPYRAVNGIAEDNAITFFNSDPQVVFSFSGDVRSLLVSGEIEKVSMAEVDQYIASKENKVVSFVKKARNRFF